MGVLTALAFVKVPAAEAGQADPEVHEMELEDHLCVELPPDSHITRGYFDEWFRDAYAQYVLAVLQGTDAPKRGIAWRCAAISGLTLWSIRSRTSTWLAWYTRTL
jgi:hypothetical protein